MSLTNDPQLWVLTLQPVCTKMKGMRSLHSKQYCMYLAIVGRLGASFDKSEVAIDCRDEAEAYGVSSFEGNAYDAVW